MDEEIIIWHRLKDMEMEIAGLHARINSIEKRIEKCKALKCMCACNECKCICKCECDCVDDFRDFI